MIKKCENCEKPFKTKDSRQKSCSKDCADVRRAQWKPSVSGVCRDPLFTTTPEVRNSVKYELPPPEELPAPYAKRVHDMWAALTGGDAPTRIA